MENGTLPNAGIFGLVSHCFDKNANHIAGDFNEILKLEERVGHGIFNPVGANDFEQAVNGFTELETLAGFFTWNNRSGPLHTNSKIDRAFGNPNWLSCWLNTSLILIHNTSSDHAALHYSLNTRRSRTF